MCVCVGQGGWVNVFEIIFTACLHELLIIADHSDGCTSKLFSDLERSVAMTHKIQNRRSSLIFILFLLCGSSVVAFK